MSGSFVEAKRRSGLLHLQTNKLQHRVSTWHELDWPMTASLRRRGKLQQSDCSLIQDIDWKAGIPSEKSTHSLESARMDLISSGSLRSLNPKQAGRTSRFPIWSSTPPMEISKEWRLAKHITCCDALPPLVKSRHWQPVKETECFRELALSKCFRTAADYCLRFTNASQSQSRINHQLKCRSINNYLLCDLLPSPSVQSSSNRVIHRTHCNRLLYLGLLLAGRGLLFGQHCLKAKRTEQLMFSECT